MDNFSPLFVLKLKVLLLEMAENKTKIGWDGQFKRYLQNFINLESVNWT